MIKRNTVRPKGSAATCCNMKGVCVRARAVNARVCVCVCAGGGGGGG
jgi:hypothetical protein